MFRGGVKHLIQKPYMLDQVEESGQYYREMVRQPYNFSPPDTTREFERLRGLIRFAFLQNQSR